MLLACSIIAKPFSYAAAALYSIRHVSQSNSLIPVGHVVVVGPMDGVWGTRKSSQELRTVSGGDFDRFGGEMK